MTTKQNLAFLALKTAVEKRAPLKYKINKLIMRHANTKKPVSAMLYQDWSTIQTLLEKANVVASDAAEEFIKSHE